MQQQAIVRIVDAFTLGAGGGNKAGVVLEGEGLLASAKQRIAAEVGLSETAFLRGAALESGADLAIEFFTPTRPISRCGHATISAAAVLAEAALFERSLTLASPAGELRLRRDPESGEIYLALGPLESQELPAGSMPEALAALGLGAGAQIRRVLVAGAGSPFLTVELGSAAALRDVNPDMNALYGLSERAGLIGAYVFAQSGGNAIEARMFAPLYGIAEEAATGMGAGAGASALAHDGRLGDLLIVRQGHLMSVPSPSELIVRRELEPGQGGGWWAGGRATLGESRAIKLDSGEFRAAG